jgi:hypothetical protein
MVFQIYHFCDICEKQLTHRILKINNPDIWNFVASFKEGQLSGRTLDLVCVCMYKGCATKTSPCTATFEETVDLSALKKN